jgi:hypothetical protein
MKPAQKSGCLKIMQDFSQMYAMEISVEGERYLTRNELQGDIFTAFRVMKIRPPLHMQLINQ